MSLPARALDTDPTVAALQIAAWRRMSPGEKLAQVDALTRELFMVAEAGLKHREPMLAPAARARRLADVRLGQELAELVYGAPGA